MFSKKDQLVERILDLEKEVFKLKNPPKFEIGEPVEVFGKEGVVLDSNVLHNGTPQDFTRKYQVFYDGKKRWVYELTPHKLETKEVGGYMRMATHVIQQLKKMDDDTV